MRRCHGNSHSQPAAFPFGIPEVSRELQRIQDGLSGCWVRRSQGQEAGSSSWGRGSSAEAPGNGPRSFSCTASPHPSPVRGAAPRILYNSRFKETSVTPSAIQAQNVNPAPGTGGSKINPAPGRENPMSAQVQGHETPTLTQLQGQENPTSTRVPGYENPMSTQMQDSRIQH